VYCRRENVLYILCAGPLWPGGGLASSETILLGVCGVSRYVSESGVGLFFICVRCGVTPQNVSCCCLIPFRKMFGQYHKLGHDHFVVRS
jgi:hypothetical protein